MVLVEHGAYWRHTQGVIFSIDPSLSVLSLVGHKAGMLFKYYLPLSFLG